MQASESYFRKGVVQMDRKRSYDSNEPMRRRGLYLCGIALIVTVMCGAVFVGVANSLGGSLQSSRLAEAAGMREASAAEYGPSDNPHDIAWKYSSRFQKKRIPIRWGMHYPPAGARTYHNGFGYTFINNVRGKFTQRTDEAIYLALNSSGKGRINRGTRNRAGVYQSFRHVVTAPVFGCTWKVVYSVKAHPQDGRYEGVMDAYKKNSSCVGDRSFVDWIETR